MPGNSVVLEFAGDASKLAREAKEANAAVENFGRQADDAAQDVNRANDANSRYEQSLGKVEVAAGGMTDAVGGITDTLNGVNDVMNSGWEKAQKHARALTDVAQAMGDIKQAARDVAQAGLDAETALVDEKEARLDLKDAQKAYNDEVKKHGKNSKEAERALIDVQRAELAIKQAQEDGLQAIEDKEQGYRDTEVAALDLQEAEREANPTDWQKFIDQVNTYSPLLSGLAAIIGILTLAQLGFNLAMWTSPITWIILGIIALIVIIVLLVKNWDKVKEAGKKAWSGIKMMAKDAWEWMKELPGKIGNAFKDIGKLIAKPFIAAFNWIADAWNNSVGALSWNFPGAFGVGAFTIDVPDIPKFHTGGVVPGAPGSEMLALLQAGETVIPANQSREGDVLHATFRIDGDMVVEAIGRVVRRRGGNVGEVLGGANA